MAKRIRWNRFDGPLPANTKTIMRPGRFGNPWVVGRDGTREECVHRFDLFLADRSQHPELSYPSDEEIVRDLAGYDLACACNYDGPCHGDPLIARIDLLQQLASGGGR
ncbi:DUF4326 domain-containing protein [Plantactinospora sp. WMMB782]|uniref:DUF4326 domain-containing protein n=1 Tax=Plantactinospora sp. WMMB782 TaxID=3404121 RepID=UPI003B92DADD